MHIPSRRFPSAACAGLLACLLGTALAQPAPATAPPAIDAARQRNVYTAGAEVHPAAAVSGDFVAAGGRVVVDQPVAGDATLVGGSIDVRARVGDDLRIAGGSISVDDRVGGDLLAAGADVTLRPTGMVFGGADLRGATVSMLGHVNGDLKATAGTVRIDGEVRGTTELAADRIELGPNAKLLGAFLYASPAQVTQAPGAVVQGPVTRDLRMPPDGRAAHMGRGRMGGGPVGWVGPFAALLACAALFLLLVPHYGEAAAERLRTSPARSLAAGLLLTLALPLAVLLLFVTVLGMPLAMLLMAAYPVLMLAGFLIGVLCVARLLPASFGQPQPAGPGARIGYFALALLVIALIGSLPVAGAGVLALLALAGLGAGILQVWRRRDSRAAVPATLTALPDGTTRPA